MEFFSEIIIEIYLELMMLIVPEKNIDKKARKIAGAFAAVMICAVIALAMWGFILIFEKNNKYGVIPITIAIVLSLAQIAAGIILYKKNH